MTTTLTMPENLDAIDSASDGDLNSLDDLPGQAIETASDCNSDAEAATILERITGQSLDSLAAQMDEGTATDGSVPEGFVSPADDAATTPETSCSSADDALQTPIIDSLPSAPSAAPVSRLSPTDDFLIQLQNAERECRRTESIVTDLKEQLKDAKTDYDSAVNKLRELASNVAEMTRNDADRPLLAVAEAAAVESPTPFDGKIGELSPEDIAACTMPTEPDTSINWPAGQVPSQIEIVKTSYDLQAATFHDCCLDDPEGVNVEDILLQQGDFCVVAWREQVDQDVIPDYVLAFRAEQQIAAESTPPTDGESWRAYPIELLELSDGTVGALHNAEIETMGALADYTKAGKFLTDIPKIGKAKVEQIENATVKFWSERPDRNPKTEASK